MYTNLFEQSLWMGHLCLLPPEFDVSIQEQLAKIKILPEKPIPQLWHEFMELFSKLPTDAMSGQEKLTLHLASNTPKKEWYGILES